jgi:hypothetical protein
LSISSPYHLRNLTGHLDFTGAGARHEAICPARRWPPSGGIRRSERCRRLGIHARAVGLSCIDPARRYPPILLVTSTRDDRAHSACARKMAAALARQGHRTLFYEFREGGHGIGTDPAQYAFWFALLIAFVRTTIAAEMIETAGRQ